MPEQTWRCSTGGLILGWIWVAITALGAVVLVVRSLVDGQVDWLLGACFFALVGAAGYSLVLNLRITATDAGVVIRNPLRQHFVPWSDVSRIVPTYWGLEIHRHDGPPVLSLVGQKSNIAAARNQLVRADHIAGALAERAHASTRRGTASDLQLTAEEHSELSRAARSVIIGGIAIIVVGLIVRLLLA